MKMNIHSSGKSLSSGDDTFLEVLTLESHVNKNERYMLENLQTIQQSAPTLSATTRASGEQMQMLGPLRVVCIRSLALAQELQQDLDESAWQFDAAIWCALARNQYFLFAFERLLMIQIRLFNVCLAFIPLLLPCDTCIEKYMMCNLNWLLHACCFCTFWVPTKVCRTSRSSQVLRAIFGRE